MPATHGKSSRAAPCKGSLILLSSLLLIWIQNRALYCFFFFFFAFKCVSQSITVTYLRTIDRLFVAAQPGGEINCYMLKRDNPGHPYTLIT